MFWIYLAVCVPCGLISVFVTYGMLFPLGFGVGELSLVEIAFIVLFDIALVRHWRRSAVVAHSLVRRILAPLAAIGVPVALMMLVFFAVPYPLEAGSAEISVMGEQLSWYAILIVSLWFSAPQHQQTPKIPKLAL